MVDVGPVVVERDSRAVKHEAAVRADPVRGHARLVRDQARAAECHGFHPVSRTRGHLKRADEMRAAHADGVVGARVRQHRTFRRRGGVSKRPVGTRGPGTA